MARLQFGLRTIDMLAPVPRRLERGRRSIGNGHGGGSVGSAPWPVSQVGTERST
jgi:hypothetical protein